MDLIYSVRAIAQSLDAIHADVTRRTADLAHDHEQLQTLVQNVLTDVHRTLLTLSEKIDKTYDRQLALTPAVGVPILSAPVSPAPVEEKVSSALELKIGKKTVKDIGMKALWFTLTGGGSVLIYEFLRFVASRW